MFNPFRGNSAVLSYDEILAHLTEPSGDRLERLRRRADALRRERVGDVVYLRGLIELSNHCRRNCLYCGVRAGRRGIARYRMTIDEVLQAASLAKRFGYGTVVLQAGEDAGLSDETIAEIIAAIKQKFSLIVTLSLGERPDSAFLRWKEAGADRYLMRLETSNRRLFEAIHPSGGGDGGVAKTTDRVAMLGRLRQMGYQIGSGVMIGIPGQTTEDLARDLMLFSELRLDMVGSGPYLPHSDTPLGKAAEALALPQDDPRRAALLRQAGWRYPEADRQVVPSNEMAFAMIALTRLLLPGANIPSTTAIATLDGQHGRAMGLRSGANVVMPNLTPTKYRALYEIYPNKAATLETPDQTHAAAIRQIRDAGLIPESDRA